ncbi:Nodulation-signaling pathway 1 protein [Nymphaea thermarum]|nr:Nodulation-signaling pathway 1 protein [Nymphaea thermarum]
MSSKEASPEARSDLFSEWLDAIEFDPVDDLLWPPFSNSDSPESWTPLCCDQPAQAVAVAGFSDEDDEIVPPAKQRRKDGSAYSTSARLSSNASRRKGSARLPSSSARKESRWAERLLNLCATAIEERNVARVQHQFYVLRDLSSETRDINHRLAAHGLQALTREFAGASSPSLRSAFAGADPRFFHHALVIFHELSPWFTVAYTLANVTLLETFRSAAVSDAADRTVHLIDIGISHGIQWPTLLEAFACEPRGPPSLVRLTVVAGAAGAPFAVGPPDNDFPTRLERFAKSVNVRLEVNIVQGELGKLTASDLGVREEERVAICLQFRLHQLGKERKRILGFLRDLSPEIVVLSDNDVDYRSSVGMAARFGRKAEFFRQFLDSTSVEFEGRKYCEERLVVEREAGMMVLSYEDQGNNQREGRWWVVGMEEVGFVRVAMSKRVLEAGRALLKKHDGNWGMKVEEACASLFWKGQPVTFCSLWKPATLNT